VRSPRGRAERTAWLVIAIADNTIYEADAHVRAFDAIANAVINGRISETRVDEAYRRVIALKQRIAA